MTWTAHAIPDVLQEHLEEFGFLSLQRRKLLFSVETNLRQLARHDRRIEAHRDALALAPADVAVLARERLAEASSSWDLMSCAYAWLSHGGPTSDEVMEAIAASGEDGADGWREAFRRLPAATSARWTVRADATSLPPPAAGVFVDAAAWHGVLPTPQARNAARSPHAAVRLAFARHASWFEGHTGSEPDLESLLQDDDVSVARAARWTRYLLQCARGSRSIDRPALTSTDPFWRLAAELLAPPGEPLPDPTTRDAWRRAVEGGDDPLAMRREIPDGFFTGTLVDEALPGH